MLRKVRPFRKPCKHCFDDAELGRLQLGKARRDAEWALASRKDAIVFKANHVAILKASGKRPDIKSVYA